MATVAAVVDRDKEGDNMKTNFKRHDISFLLMMKDTPMSGEMMEQRMEMMQSMVEQMLEHQSKQTDMTKQ